MLRGGEDGARNWGKGRSFSDQSLITREGVGGYKTVGGWGGGLQFYLTGRVKSCYFNMDVFLLLHYINVIYLYKSKFKHLICYEQDKQYL